MKNNLDKIKDLEEYLKKTEKSKNLNKLSNKIRMLINYYKNMKNKDNAELCKVSIRTINRLVKEYEEKGMQVFISGNYTGRKPKLSEEVKIKIEKTLLKNPLKLGLAFSIWNGNLLKRYIFNKFNIVVSKVFCEKILSESDTYYKSQNYNTIKNKELNKMIEDMIEKYESNKKYSVWYFDTYYLGKNPIKEMVVKPSKEGVEKFSNTENNKIKIDNIKRNQIELMLRGKDVSQYKKYYVYGFFNLNEPLEYDIKNRIDKKAFIKILDEFIHNKINEIGNKVNLLIIMDSDNIFKSITAIDKLCDNKQIKILFLPKNTKSLNKINYIWNKLDENKFDINGFKHAELEDKFENYISKVLF